MITTKPAGTLTALPSTLVVVPALDEAACIESVIRVLLAGLPSAAPVTLVVADGGSRDGTIDLVARLSREDDRIKLVHNTQRIQSAGVNLAVKTHGMGCAVLVRCDAHAFYPDNFLHDACRSLLAHDADEVVVPMDASGTTPWQCAIAWASDSLIGSGGSAHRGGRRSGFVDHGHHAAFRMEAFRGIGGYDETFTHNEDAELDVRHRASGGRIYLDADLRIGYMPRKDLTALWHQYFNYGRGRSRTIRKHPQSWRARQLLVPLHLVVQVMCLVLGIFNPWFWMLPLFYGTALMLNAVWLAILHRSADAWRTAPACAVMHTAWGAGFWWGLMSTREPRWQATCVPL